MRLAELPSSRSLIGVAVAVAGNVTISLALNCQKLAHLHLQHRRQSKDQDQDQDQDQDGDRDGNRDGNEDPDTLALPHHDLMVPNQSSSSSLSGNKQTDIDHDETLAQDRGSSSPASGSGSSMSPSNGTNTDFLKSKLWWLGIALMTLGEAGNFISYGFAPASLVAPLGAVALLSNVIISPLMLNEEFKPADIGGILLAIIGAVTVVFSSKESDTRLGPDGLLHAVKRLEFIIYASVAAGVGGVLFFLSRTRLADRIVLIDVGTCAIFGGFTVLSTKGISSLISGGRPLEALRYPITYILFLVLAGTAVIQITYLNKALQRFDSRQVIPTQFVLFTISAIVGSAVLYRDFENTDVHQVVNFLFGCLTTFAGVFLLTRRREDSSAAGSRQQVDEPSETERLLATPTAARVTPIQASVRPVGSPPMEAILSRSAGTAGLRTPRLGISAGHYLLLADTPPPLNLSASHKPTSSYGSFHDLPFSTTDDDRPRRRKTNPDRISQA